MTDLEPTKEEVDAFRDAFNAGWEDGESTSVRRGLRAVYAMKPMLTSDEADDLRDVLFFYDLDKSHPAAYEKLTEIAEMDD